ncbi:MAG: bacteriohemerythrin [Deltaproteobacteria bacterium]|jgi:hemerythrin-like metal-binding protein|nr:bacteriohemerythrin [Deltaproteobacteria bacterium]
MAEKFIVTWQSSYSVGIKLIDEQHMELIKLTNKLFASCMEGKSKNIFLDTIHEAVDYVGYHFGTEEKVMERINYPDYASHKKEHADFVREVFSKVEEFKAGKILAPLSFVYYLKDWVLHHIAVCDKKMGAYLIAMKRSGALQQVTLEVKKDDDNNRMHIR